LARLDELKERLRKRFRDVPNVEDEDLIEWVELSLNQHNYGRADNVPNDVVPLIMLYAEAEAASSIALRTAHYFDYDDNNESVRKAEVSKNYIELSEHLWERYRFKRNTGENSLGGSFFSIMTRADR